MTGSAQRADEEATWDVLIVDDEAVVREGVRKILEAQGLRVAAAPDAGSALAHPALRRCRVVLCDLILPDRPGTDLLHDIRSVRPDLPVVMITGYATSDHEGQARLAGATEFLTKPFEESELLEVVRRILSGHHAAGRESRS